jgi:hypothetical protein
MKGYTYITRTGTDPQCGTPLKDPTLDGTPSLGACMPNVRKWVVIGDHVFVISGKVPGVQQYVVGGFEVAEKMHAIEAYRRFRSYASALKPEPLRATSSSPRTARSIRSTTMAHSKNVAETF